MTVWYIVDENMQRVQELDDEDCCLGARTGEMGEMCGGCGRCLLAQAHHYGVKLIDVEEWRDKYSWRQGSLGFSN